jgi:uncharacterized MAPEG superfamily protein
MTIQIASLLIGCLIPILWSAAALPYRQRQLGRVDYEQPRLQASQLTGRGAAVWGAQLNAWEALAIFTVANISGFFAGLESQGLWEGLCIIWVVARLAHGFCYLYEKVSLRIVSFAISTLSAFGIMILALMQ